MQGRARERLYELADRDGACTGVWAACRCRSVTRRQRHTAMGVGVSRREATVQRPKGSYSPQRCGLSPRVGWCGGISLASNFGGQVGGSPPRSCLAAHSGCQLCGNIGFDLPGARTQVGRRT